jgi:putative transposase
MWLHLRGRGNNVARCTVERLYREQDWVGALRLKKVRTTLGDPAAERPLDLVDRQFWASRPNQLWVADFTYVATWAGTVYVAFIFDVFSRRIVGWRAATRMTTDLVLDTLEHAIWTRQRAGVTDLSGLIHHTDAGLNTSVSPSPSGSSTRVSTLRSGPSAMPTTTPLPSRRSGSSRPS